jgi:hypothetical protein
VESTRHKPNWRSRLFGVACDSEEAERWLDALVIYEHLASISKPDLELQFRIMRVSVELRERRLATAALAKFEKLFASANPEERAAIAAEVEAMRERVEELASELS